MKYIPAALSLVVATATAAPSSLPLLKELPDTGAEWMTLQDGIEVQPAANLSPLAQQHWRRLTWLQKKQNDTTAYDKIFVDGAETRYDDYAQAWRALGFYIDCDANAQNGGRRERKLQNNNNQKACTRYLLWAAVSIRLHWTAFICIALKAAILRPQATSAARILL